MHSLLLILQVAGWTMAGGLILALVLNLLPHLGSAGRAAAAACIRAPLLDVVVALFTWAPWVFGAVLAGWRGLAGAVLGQIVGLYVWAAFHELTHMNAIRGPRIIRVINRLVGRWRNHGALWVTLIAVPGFWIIRLHEWLAYPLLIWLLGFPRYRQSEWINVSRQKFDGLVGHDLAWCLYCDWMTGVYSLGAEMLRNVESFWCPIRFYEGKKCANCRTDFPDMENGWVPADGNMAQVTQVLEEKYGDGQRAWFGHPARTPITVRGKAIETGTR